MSWLSSFIIAIVVGIVGIVGVDVPIFDHAVVQRDVVIGMNQTYMLFVEPDVPIGSFAHFLAEYTYPGDATRIAYASASADGVNWGEEKMLPLEDISNAVSIEVTPGGLTYLRIRAVSMPGATTLTIEVTSIITNPLDDSPIYGGKTGGDGLFPYYMMYDVVDFHSTWMEIEQEDMWLFIFNSTGGLRSFCVDLKYNTAHDMDLYGKLGSIPSKTVYDWKRTSSSAIGTLITTQNLTEGVWYIGVYGENVIWPADTSTTSLEMSWNDDFEVSGASGVMVGMIIALGVIMSL